MREDKSLLIKLSMNLGLIFGGYWCFKYIFLMLGVYWPVFSIVYWILTMGIPFLAYRLTVIYRKSLGDQIGVFHAWQFGVLLYFFAAILVSLLHYAFYNYIAPEGFIEEAYTQTLNLLKSSKMSEDVIKQIAATTIPSAIQMTFQDILNNVFYGVLLSIPVAWSVKKKNELVG